AAGVPQAAQVGRRVNLGADTVAAQQFRLATQRPIGLGALPERGQLPVLGRDRQFSGALEATVDPVPGDGVGDLIQVARAEPLQGLDFPAESLQAVGQAMGEAGRAEAPVAPEATVRASSSTTSEDGSRSLASSAVHSPVNPPPITARLAAARPASGEAGPGAPGWSGQCETGRAP